MLAKGRKVAIRVLGMLGADCKWALGSVVGSIGS